MLLNRDNIEASTASATFLWGVAVAAINRPALPTVATTASPNLQPKKATDEMPWPIGNIAMKASTAHRPAKQAQRRNVATAWVYAGCKSVGGIESAVRKHSADNPKWQARRHISDSFDSGAQATGDEPAARRRMTRAQTLVAELISPARSMRRADGHSAPTQTSPPSTRRRSAGVKPTAWARNPARGMDDEIPFAPYR
jgi:hypothetical protein